MFLSLKRINTEGLKKRKCNKTGSDLGFEYSTSKKKNGLKMMDVTK